MRSERHSDSDADIRAAFQRQRVRISSQLDVEEALRRIERGGERGRIGAGIRRPLLALAGGFALVLLLIGVVALLASSLRTPDDLVPVTAGSIPPTTAVPPTTPTTIPRDESDVWQDGRYTVVGAPGATSVPLQAQPGATDRVLLELELGERVTLTGEVAPTGRARYFGVAVQGQTGWVDSMHLGPPDAWRESLEARPCVSDETAYASEGTTQLPGTEELQPGGGPGHVLDVLHDQAGDCDRFVFVLGSGPGIEPDGTWTGVPAASVPAGTEVTVAGSRVSLTFPGVNEIRPLAITTEYERAFGLASRTVDGIAVHLFLDGAGRVAAQVLDNPARVVVDVRPAVNNTAAPAQRGGEFVVMPIATSPEAGATVPVTISGWGRPNEATGVAELRRAGGKPATGELVEARFDSAASGSELTSRYVFATTDWVLWGEFSLTVDEVAPGEYELFIGENTPSEGNPGVYLRFTILE